MASSAGQRQLLKFGVFDVDLATGEIRKAGMRLKLAPQPFQVLQVLLEHPHKVVTREELRERVWPDNTFVDYELALKKAINRLRDVLGDSADNPHFIETVPRRGYRFIGTLTSREAEDNSACIGDSRLPSAVDATTIAPDARSTAIFTRWRIVTVLALLLVGIATGWLVAHWRHAPSPLKHRRLTANSQEEPVIGGVISPNGEYLAFADKTGFYLQQIANGETHALTLPAGFNPVPVCWYPDSAHIVADWVEGPKSPTSLWQIPIMGGAPRKLSDNGEFASVSRDGSQIAFLRGDSPNQEMWVMRGNGEDSRRVAVATQISSFGQPAWSPDGKRLAFATDTLEPGQWGSSMNVTMLDLGSGQQRVVFTPHDTNPDLDSTAQLGPALVWTADNHLIYAVTEPPPNQTDFNLWQIALDDSGRVTGRASRLTSTPGGILYLNGSVNGTKIAYTKFSFTSSVYISELRANGAAISAPQRLTLDDWTDIPFAWTPDSKSVIFVSDRDGTFHIFKQQIDQTIAELLVGGGEQVNIPRLAPDNSSLFYLVWPKVGDSAPTRLMRVSLAGGSPQEVLRDSRIGNIQCARPPSKVCMYHSESATELNLFRFDPVTGKSEILPQFKIENRAPGWNLSPDGKTLVTMTVEGPQQDPSLRLHSLEDGSGRTVRVKAWARIHGGDFAADSKSLWVTAFANTGKWSLLNVDLQGNIRTMLEDTDVIQWAVPAPDGKHLALAKSRSTSNAWLLERQ